MPKQWHMLNAAPIGLLKEGMPMTMTLTKCISWQLFTERATIPQQIHTREESVSYSLCPYTYIADSFACVSERCYCHADSNVLPICFVFMTHELLLFICNFATIAFLCLMLMGCPPIFNWMRCIPSETSAMLLLDVLPSPSNFFQALSLAISFGIGCRHHSSSTMHASCWFKCFLYRHCIVFTLRGAPIYRSAVFMAFKRVCLYRRALCLLRWAHNYEIGPE